MNPSNIILNTDSYKASHYSQYPPDTRYISSYIESRGGRFGETLFLGLQMFLQEYLTTPVSHEDVAQAAEILAAHGVPFNRAGWQHIVDRHAGLMPLEIEAVAEGSILPVGNALVQVMNTDPACAWLTSYIETALLRAIWYPTTVATLAWHCRQVIRRYLLETADSLEGLEFRLHDFSARGATSEEAAAIGGVAHLVSFSGSDNLSGVMAARRHYGASMAGFSIPAAEHSTITVWGKDKESEAYANMLAQFAGPGKTVAVVSDSWNLWHAIEHIWGEQLRERIINSGGTLVIRPDSGDPVEVVCGTIQRLMQKFGSRTNQRGFRVLPDCIRIIQGDGIGLESLSAILEKMKQQGLSAENISFGMGGALLQKVDRDTQSFAMKASAAEVSGHWRDVSKNPVTDASKRSKQGRLAVIREAEKPVRTIRLTELGDHPNLLQPVFRNGRLLRQTSLSEIRANAGTAS